MDKLQKNLHRMELMNKKPCKYLNAEVQRIKEDVVSHIDLQAWDDNIEDSI